MLLPLDAGEQRLEYIPVGGNLKSVPARFGLHLARIMYDDGVKVRKSPSLAALIPEAMAYLSEAEVESLGVEPGAMVTVAGESGSVTLPLAVDNSLGEGTVYIPANLSKTSSLGAAVSVSDHSGRQGMSGWAFSLEAAIKAVAVFAFVLITVIILVWFERKIVADMQNRLGPMRAGPYGILQTVADGVKLLFKEPVVPRKVEYGIYMVAPIAALVPAILIFMVIPIGRPFTLGDRVINLAGTDLNVALLYVLAMSSIAVYAVVLAGWSSGSKYPLLGAVRASAQMISYEAAMGLALVPVVMFSGSTSFTQIVESQMGSYFSHNSFLSFIPAWHIILIPSFVIFFVAGVAETNRAPFDLVEAENELVGGYHTEYGGFRFAMFFLAEYANIFNISALDHHAVPRWLAGTGLRDTRLDLLALPDLLVHVQDIPDRLRVCVDPGVVAPDALRPVDDLRLEAPDPVHVAVDHAHGRRSRRPRFGFPMELR